eukprot:scaffold316_cov122-Skeletonema_dohrnii-CCMP3373.AAC.13
MINKVCILPHHWFNSRVVKHTTRRASLSTLSSSCDELIRRYDDTVNSVTTLTLNNPKKYNVLSSAVLDAMQLQLDDIAANDSISVLVISSTGRAFSAGHDLKEIHAHGTNEETVALFQKCSKLMMSVNKLPQPVIASVQGIATAAGCQLVASCDLAVAANEATFGVSGINVGLFCSTPAVALSRNVHAKQAMHMLLTGDLISSEQAVAYGLVNKAVSLEKLEAETMMLAKKVASKSNYAIRLGKDVFYKQLQCDDLKDAYELTTERIASNFQHDDTKRMIAKFVNK